MTTRVRKTKAVNMEEYLRKHSPLKKGLVVKDEDRPIDNYSKIMDRLYLGNYLAAKDPEFFKKKNIKAVLNCTKDIPNKFRVDDTIEYMRLPVDDSLKDVDIVKMYNFLPAAIEFIHKHIVTQKHPIFIHCHAGRQRSAVCVLAYLTIKCGMSQKDAMDLMLKKRPEVFHFGLSYNFQKSFEKLYKQMTKK